MIQLEMTLTVGLKRVTVKMPLEFASSWALPGTLDLAAEELAERLNSIVATVGIWDERVLVELDVP